MKRCIYLFGLVRSRTTDTLLLLLLTDVIQPQEEERGESSEEGGEPSENSYVNCCRGCQGRHRHMVEADEETLQKHKPCIRPNHGAASLLVFSSYSGADGGFYPFSLHHCSVLITEAGNHQVHFVSSFG